MKNNNKGETLMGSLLPIALLAIGLALVIPACNRMNRRAKENKPVPTAIGLKVNDTVYIPSIQLTGVVNNIDRDGKTAYIITDRATKLDYVNTSILRKVPLLENK